MGRKGLRPQGTVLRKAGQVDGESLGRGCLLESSVSSVRIGPASEPPLCSLTCWKLPGKSLTDIAARDWYLLGS